MIIDFIFISGEWAFISISSFNKINSTVYMVLSPQVLKQRLLCY